MNLSTIRDEWRVPARLGQRVSLDLADAGPSLGTIVGERLGTILIRIDDGSFPIPFHPRSRYLTYLKG